MHQILVQTKGKFFLLLFLLSISSSIIKGEEVYDYNLSRARKAFKIGWTHYQRGEYPLAIESFHRAIAIKPSFYPARIWLGDAYLKSGYVENAIETWQTAIDLGIDDNFVRQKLSYILFNRQQEFLPITDFEHTVSIFGNDLSRKIFLRPTGILSTKENLLLVSGFSSRNVLLFDINGDVKRSFQPKLQKPFKKPYGLAVSPDKRIFVTDFGNDRIYIFEENGKFLGEFGQSGIDEGQFSGPEGITIDDNGSIYIVDNGNSRVQKFSAAGELLMSFGKKGHGKEELYRPSGITMNKESIFISDTGNSRIQRFDYDGQWIESIGEGLLSTPRGIKIKDNLLVVADGKNGLFFYEINSRRWWKKSYWNGGEFRFSDVVDVEFSKSGNALYAADFSRNSIDIFEPVIFKYSDLRVQINRMHTTLWPDIAVFLTVSTPDGRLVPGLTEKNFHIWEDGIPVPFFTIDKTFKDKTFFIFLVERSLQSAKFGLERKTATELILGKRTDKDVFKVINVGNKIWTGLNWSQAFITLTGRIETDRTTEDVKIGTGLYRSISELCQISKNKAIIFFTTGIFDIEETFAEYSFDTVLNFAKTHHIPIFIVAFSEENKDILTRLAKETGGVYCYYYTSASLLPSFYEMITKRDSPEYVLKWKTSRNTKEQKWRNVEVRVDVRSQTGKDRSGYFLP